jgi:uncharacterized membrane protein YfcA
VALSQANSRRRHHRRGDRLLDRQACRWRQAFVPVCACNDRGRHRQLRPRAAEGDPSVSITPAIALRLTMIGLIVGAFSGFFGIGGGFLIVPGIMLGSGMPILNAIGSSLLSVGTFGPTTAVNYAVSGLVDWTIAALFIAGGLVGGFFGMRAAVHLAANRRMLAFIFAAVIFVVAIYMLIRTGLPLWRAIFAKTSA